MKVLWISPSPSHPQNAGNRAHIFAMGQQILAAGHHVTFLLYGQETVTEEAKADMQQFWSEFIFVPHRLRDRRKTKGELWGIDDWFNVDLEAAVRFLQSQNQYDAVYCEYVFFSKALTLFPSSVLKILSCHDRMSNRADLLTKHGISPDFFYTSQDQEKIALNRADIVIAIQEDEREFFQSLTNKITIEVGYPVDSSFLPSRALYGKLKIGYLGSNNSLNRKSLDTFLSILQSDPELSSKVEVIVAGTICNGLEDAPVTRLGVVSAEADLYREVDLLINPMLDGTGLKIKTLSAIRHAMPFLSTETGSKGIPTSLNEHQCESVGALVQHLTVLVAEPAERLSELRSESQRLFEVYRSRQYQQTRDLLHAIATRSTRHLRTKQVLVVTDVPFWEPGLGSHARILGMCNEIKKHFKLTVFFFGSVWETREQQIAKAGFAGSVVSYKIFEEAGKKVKGKISCPSYPGLDRWRHETYFRSFKAFLASRPRFDTVIFEYLWLAYTRDALWYPTITILDSHDLMAYRDYRFTSQGIPVGVSISLQQEVTLLDRFDSVVAIQHEEAEILSAALKKAIPLCCPHGVELGDKTEDVPMSDELRLGFVGGNSEANFVAIDWFLRQVWPVLKHLPISLHVFGGVCQRVSPLAEKVQLHGIVEDLSSVYALCDVMINPMIHGGGIKIKSIEALANGKPLIASPEGAVGIATPGDSGVIVASTRGEFIDAVLKMLGDKHLRLTMAEAARCAAEIQFSSRHCYAPLIELIESA